MTFDDIPSDKTMGEMTDEELALFRDKLREDIGQESFDALGAFFTTVREAADHAGEFLRRPEVVEIGRLIMEMLPKAIKIIESDEELRLMSFEDACESGKFAEAFKKAAEETTGLPSSEDSPGQTSLFPGAEAEATRIIELANLYTHTPGTALTNVLKQFMNNPTRIESPRRGQITVAEHYLTKDTIITYKSKDGEYTVSVERVSELFAKRVQNGAKIFNFLLQKLNEQNYQENTEFLLSELVDAGIYANPDSAYRGLKTVLDKLMHMHVEGTVMAYQGRKRKQIASTKAAIVAARSVTYNKCVAVLPQIIRNNTSYITILPRWAYALANENAYILLDYIYYLARQNTVKIKERGYFPIGLDTIRMHLGLPAPKEVQKGNYNKLIIKPIEDAITAIEDAITANEQQDCDLKITPIYNPDYKNIHEYLDGYIEVRLSGTALEYMEQRAIKEETRRAEARRINAKTEAAKTAKHLKS